MVCLQGENVNLSQPQETENGRAELCDESRRSSAADTPAEHQNEQKIQNDVRTRGYDHGTQRRAAVPQ